MGSKYLLICCYDCEINVSVHNSYHDVEEELRNLSFDEDTVQEILIGDTYTDWEEAGYVKVQRIEVTV